MGHKKSRNGPLTRANGQTKANRVVPTHLGLSPQSVKTKINPNISVQKWYPPFLIHRVDRILHGCEICLCCNCTGQEFLTGWSMVKSDKNMQKIGERKEKKRSHRNLICLIFLATLHTNDHDQWFGCMWRRRRPFLLIVRTILHPRSRPDLQNGLEGFNYRQPPFLCLEPYVMPYMPNVFVYLYLRMFLHPQSHFAKHA